MTNANHSAAVLRNKGVCVTINDTAQDEETGNWELVRGKASGDPKTTTAWVRFDGNALADIEAAWGSMAAYQEATGATPFSTVRRTLSIVLGWDDLHAPNDPTGKLCSGCRRAGLAMVDGNLNEYSTAVGAGLAMANGLDPTRVARLIQQGVRAAKSANVTRDEALDEMLDEKDSLEASLTASTSTDGSPNGSEPVAATTSSGD